MDTEKVQRITPIRNGTVIDHITPKSALTVLRILDLPGDHDGVISVGISVRSHKLQEGRKDIIKVEDLYPDARMLNKIALIAPNATIVRIKDGKVVEKSQVRLTDEVIGIVRCPNERCISNANEPVQPRFRVMSRESGQTKIRCEFCDRVLFHDEISKYAV
ncbi:MAG: aspartate carbamoyltransferase regulatory subunit [Promethearchaeota archaeon]